MYGEFEPETSYSVDSGLNCEFNGNSCSDSKCQCDTAAAEAFMALRDDLVEISKLPATE